MSSSSNTTLRYALFVPQYERDEKTGVLRGLGTGFAASRITPEFARRQGLTAEMVGYPTPPSVMEALNAGECDVAWFGIDPSREKLVDFSPPVFEFDYTFLVPSGSSIKNLRDADQSGVTIALMDGHASALALRKLVKHASFVAAHMPDDAFALLSGGTADALACPRDVLMDYTEKLPGSRVVEQGYGVNRVGMAIRKGQPELLAQITAFVEEIRASGFVKEVTGSRELRGFRPATSA